MCNCIKEIESRAFEKIKKDKEKIGDVTKCEVKEVGFDFSNGKVITYNNIEYRMTNKKKDGSMGATKNYTISIYHTYCPFCGKEIYPKSDENELISTNVKENVVGYEN